MYAADGFFFLPMIRKSSKKYAELGRWHVRLPDDPEKAKIYGPSGWPGGKSLMMRSHRGGR